MRIWKIAAALLCFILIPQAGSAVTIDIDNQTAFSINDIEIGDRRYNVIWEVNSDSIFFGDRLEAQVAINDVLNKNDVSLVGIGNNIFINNFSIVDGSNFVTSTSFSLPGEWQDFTSLGLSGVRAVIIEVAPIPLPSSVLLFLTGISSLGLFYRKRIVY